MLGNLDYATLKDRYELLCETSTRQLQKISEQQQLIDHLQRTQQQMLDNQTRLQKFAKEIEQKCFDMRTLVIAMNVQGQLASNMEKRINGHTSITIGSDGNHE